MIVDPARSASSNQPQLLGGAEHGVERPHDGHGHDQRHSHVHGQGVCAAEQAGERLQPRPHPLQTAHPQRTLGARSPQGRAPAEHTARATWRDH